MIVAQWLMKRLLVQTPTSAYFLYFDRYFILFYFIYFIYFFFISVFFLCHTYMYYFHNPENFLTVKWYVLIKKKKKKKIINHLYKISFLSSLQFLLWIHLSVPNEYMTRPKQVRHASTLHRFQKYPPQLPSHVTKLFMPSR